MSKDKLTDIQIVQGAATILTEKLLIDMGTNQGSITIGMSKNKDEKPRFFRIVVTELKEKDVEHYNGTK